MALINIQDVKIGFGDALLLAGANLQIQAGERVCLIGRNGTGKTTLMRLINRDIEPEEGEISRQQGLTTTLLTQEIPTHMAGSVFEVVMEGLGEKGKLAMEHHSLSLLLAENPSPTVMNQLDRVHKALDACGGWEITRQADTIISRMTLNPDAMFNQLSAGLKRRTLLARALVCQPDLLLLDEPTNHLDIEAITWLEEFLVRLRSTLLFVTHDRSLVRKLATRIIELDRGQLTSWDCDYDTYLERKELALNAEQQQWNVFDKKLAQEEVWLRRGVKARRTRDEGRVAALLRMREQRRARLELMGDVKMSSQDAGLSGKLVIEADSISFSYPAVGDQPEKIVIKDLTTMVMRGDRVGIIGPNGCGKSTLIRLLLGELEQQKGAINMGTHLKIAYFDQLRNQLDEEKSVQENVANGRDRFDVDGKTRHVIGYLGDFLFTPERARLAVKVLSGGERNRLLLAKLFAMPSNLLVMDEPTNDLDMDTLELLEELLVNYKGTVLLVSHDRTFLNNVVTSTLVFEGNGQVSEYVGGYDDWLLQRPPLLEVIEPVEKKIKNKDTRKQDSADLPRKLTHKEKLELEAFPERIEKLEQEEAELYAQLADPVFYQSPDGEKVVQVNKRLEVLKLELLAAYQRWEELEDIKAKYLAAKG